MPKRTSKFLFFSNRWSRGVIGCPFHTHKCPVGGGSGQEMRKPTCGYGSRGMKKRLRRDKRGWSADFAAESTVRSQTFVFSEKIRRMANEAKSAQNLMALPPSFGNETAPWQPGHPTPVRRPHLLQIPATPLVSAPSLKKSGHPSFWRAHNCTEWFLYPVYFSQIASNRLKTAYKLCSEASSTPHSLEL